MPKGTSYTRTVRRNYFFFLIITLTRYNPIETGIEIPAIQAIRSILPQQLTVKIVYTHADIR